MKYAENLSLKEISFLLNRSEDSIKTALYRGRKQLKKEWRKRIMTIKDQEFKNREKARLKTHVGQLLLLYCLCSY